MKGLHQIAIMTSLAPLTPFCCPGNDSNESPKRRAAMEAAFTLFMRSGFGAVSMEAIAKEAGISKATLYAHFQSKDELFTTMVAERCEAMQVAMSGAASHELPLGEALLQLGNFWLRFMISPEALAVYRVVVAEARRFPELVRGFYDAGPIQMRAWFSRWVAEEQKRGRLRPDASPAEASGHLVSLIRGEIHLRLALDIEPMPGEADLRAAIAGAVRVFIRAYATDPAESERAVQISAG